MSLRPSDFVMSRSRRGFLRMLTGAGVAASGLRAADKQRPRYYPPPGHVLHIAGQDRRNFQDYIDNVCGNGAELGLPAGAAFYTGLELHGVSVPKPGDPYPEDLPYLLDAYEPLALQFAFDLTAEDLEPVATGEHDEVFVKLAHALRAANRPVYLRIGYEFSGVYRRYEPDSYQRAYRHIADLLRRERTHNVAYVWHAGGSEPTYKNLELMSWYPGDEYVDWVGASIFFWDKLSFTMAGQEMSFTPHRDKLLAIAREKSIPLMICEAAAVRMLPEQKNLSGSAYWDFWYARMFDFIESNPDVRAFSIINCDWDAIEQFRILNWGDTRLKQDEVVLERWRRKMSESRYVHSSPSLYELIGFGGN